MAAQETDGTPRSTASDSSTTAQQPGPDLMLGLWTSWMKTHSEAGPGLGRVRRPLVASLV